jgi:hypothetical protein
MRKGLIVALVGINVVLLLALVLGYAAPPAKAQVIGGGTDYLLVTGKSTGGTVDAVYVIDLGKRKLGAWKFDVNSKRLLQYTKATRDLKRDFKREESR